MARFRVYIKPFLASGEYADDYVEITEDVVSMGAISQNLDNTEYDVGVFRNSGFNLKLRNDKGLYSDVGTLKTIFRYKRTDSLVKVTFDENDSEPLCGFVECGEFFLSDEIEIFEGLLSEISSTIDVVDQIIEFKVLGFESLFDRALVPFGAIANGDTIKEVIMASLEQSIITDLLDVDTLNIIPAVDVALDDIESLENQTVKEMLQVLLFASNSVLFLEGRTVRVSSRAPSADLEFTFYGQAAHLGIENIIGIKNYRDGKNRLFNFWTWQDTNFFSEDVSSTALYGVLKKEIESRLVTLEASIQSLLDANKTEFANPKIEFELETPLRENMLELFLLDKVCVDYPAVYTSADANPLPRYGQNTSIYGDSRYPFAQSTITIPRSYRFKVLSRKIDPAKQTATFGLRQI